MSNGPVFEPNGRFDPVQEILRGADPAVVARRAGISVEALLQRRDAYLHMQAQRAQQEDVLLRRVGRNEACPCGSGRKYKKCCMHKQQEILSGMDPDEVKALTRREREKEERERRVQEGYRLLTSGAQDKARAFAQRWLETHPQDDRFHDILATCALHRGDAEEAIRITRSRWQAAVREKEFFLSHGVHSYDEPGSPLGHAYAPKAWLERYFVALKSGEYRARYPENPDSAIVERVQRLRTADDLSRFSQQREEGLKVRKEALVETIQAFKELGSKALPYLLPQCTMYGWTALLIPDILLHWGDDLSIRALVEISIFHYPFLSESCLRALETLGDRALPFLKEAFQKEGEFDALKIGLISVAGQIGTPEAMDWVMDLLDHPDPSVVNWAGGVLGKHGFVSSLEKLKEANLRIGREPKMEWAIEELSRRTKN